MRHLWTSQRTIKQKVFGNTVCCNVTEANPASTWSHPKPQNYRESRAWEMVSNKRVEKLRSFVGVSGDSLVQ